MHNTNGTSNHNKFSLLIAAATIVAATFGYTSIVGAQEVEFQEFILTDGVTVTDIEPVLEGEANHGAYEGGPTGTVDDTRINLAIPEVIQRGGGGGFNIPTGAPPSPLLFLGEVI
jgi:hypothetical protein